MLVQGGSSAYPVDRPDTPNNSNDSPNRQFTVQMADELLRTTGQYDKWSAIRKNDPAKAEQIAQLVMDRHAYLSGDKAPGQADRLRFDQLTDDLRKEGVFLYKSDQFRDPVFPDAIDNASSTASAAKTAEYASRSDSSSTRTAKGEESAQDVNGDIDLGKLQAQFARKDCLEFVAGMLEENGINYYGKDGLAGKLIAMARNQGKNPYSLLTGEGVTKLLSDNPVTINITDAQLKTADEVYKELEPHLKEGAILSYSSSNFGHTGIVNRKDGQWMYLNSSGRFGAPSSYRVLEEDLKSEISGWLRRADRNNTFINITLGVVNSEKASAYGSQLISSRSSDREAINLLA